MIRLSEAEFMYEASRYAEARFSDLNCRIYVRRVASNDFEVRAASNAFEFYTVTEFSAIELPTMEALRSVISGMRERMIASIFRDGGRVRNGYPRGHMYEVAS